MYVPRSLAGEIKENGGEREEDVHLFTAEDQALLGRGDPLLLLDFLLDL